MKLSKLKISIFALVLALFPILFSGLINFQAYKYPTAHGWGISSDGRIYLGVNEGILIFQDGAFINSIYIRGDFAIKVEDDILWVAKYEQDTYLDRYSLDGTLLGTQNYAPENIYVDFISAPNTFVSEDNVAYTVKQSGLFQDHIQVFRKSGENSICIYKSSFMDTLKFGNQGGSKFLLLFIYYPAVILVSMILIFVSHFANAAKRSYGRRRTRR